MRRKLILRGLAFAVVAMIGAGLINPYTRQAIFGPTLQGTPLCVWQERVRRDVLGEAEQSLLAKFRRLFEGDPKSLPFDSLTADEQVFLLLGFLDDPNPTLRARAIQTLWGSRAGMAGTICFFDGPNGPVVFSGGITLASSTFWSGDSMRFLQVKVPPNIAPHLLRMLDDPHDEVRAAAIQALSGQGKEAQAAFPRLFELLNHADPKRRTEAVVCLNHIHPKTKAWLSRLLGMLDDDKLDSRLATIGCLRGWSDRRMAVTAGPRLLKLLQDREPSVRIQAAYTLGTLRVHLADATATLAWGLRHPNASVRIQAIGHLFEPAGAALYPDLVRCVRFDPDLPVRRAAVNALTRGGRQAVPLLVSLLQHPDTEMRNNALGALANLGPEARTALPHLLHNLEELGPPGIDALVSLGDADAVPKLIELLDHRDWRGRALAALRSFGPEAKAALPKVLVLVNDPQAEVSSEALQTLACIDPDHEETFPALERVLMNDATKHAAIAPLFYIIYIGTQDRRVVPLLLRRLETSANSSHRHPWIQILGNLGPEARSAAPALLRLGRAEDEIICDAVIYALGNIGAEENDVVPWLTQLVRKEKFVPSAVAALGRFGPRAAAALPYLIPLLKSDDANLRITAAQALCQIAVRPDDIIPHLLPLLRDNEEHVRSSVAAALGGLGPNGRAAIPALVALLDDDSQSIYEAALNALAEIEP